MEPTLLSTLLVLPDPLHPNAAPHPTSRLPHTPSPTTPNILQEVDREQLSGTVLKLISSVASTAPTDDKSREAVIWHPAAVAVNTQSRNDPLGFGKIDVVNLRLVRMEFSVKFTV
jgi:hypothetical protein